jgi:type II secretory pathway pseudopilin PulG
MATNCPVCAEPLPPGADACPSCGEPAPGTYSAAPPRKSSTGMILLIVGCVLFGGIFLIAIIAAIAIPNLLAAKLSANETAAIATLRNLASAQAMAQGGGRIDVDGDGIGEFGTFLEMTGSVGVRQGPAKDGTMRGRTINPPILTAALSMVDGQGIVTKSGYAFVIYLPDASGKGWVHETGPAGAAALSGAVGTDAAEERWCAYAWPVARGNSGNRCFFVNQEGDVYQSANDGARHSGVGGPVPADSAFPAGSLEPVPGQAGADGDAWKIVN